MEMAVPSPDSGFNEVSRNSLFQAMDGAFVHVIETFQ